MKKELSPVAVVVSIAAVVVIAALILIFGVFKPQIGAGPEVKPKPWGPQGYTGVPADAGKNNQQGGPVRPAPYGGPSGPMGAHAGPPANTNGK